MKSRQRCEMESSQKLDCNIIHGTFSEGKSSERNSTPLRLASLVLTSFSQVYNHGLALPALLPSVFLIRSRNLLPAAFRFASAARVSATSRRAESAGRRRCGAKVWLFRARPLHGSPRRFFPLCCERIHHRPGAADFFIDLDKGPLQLPIAAKGFNLAFGLAPVVRRGEAFGDRFAIHLIG